MEIIPIAHFRSPLKSKFGIPRQSGLAGSLTGSIVFEPPYRRMEAFRGIEDFDYLWIIWEFSEDRGKRKEESGKRILTVRPPRLGGNTRMGVFATRSPFRPNNLGLSCVRFDRLEEDPVLGPVIYVKGADLMDGTPIYDIKPYVVYADSHPEAKSGFVDQTVWKSLAVEIPEHLAKLFSAEDLDTLRQTLALDPRPSYHDDPQRIYGMPFGDYDVRFRVEDETVTVVECL
ncbi:MAG: tRNA (N6-threonylcarbamoyladenosine(37)-N6)-methyltransferase TrmO [Prevotella sp.]|nr:tRNA (N6-threonylcarbamoyladenosine(37)-N6)-methyltransferase TrmO [Prevotella sp.]